MTMLDLGNGNYVNANRVVAIANPDSLPVRRLVQDGKDAGRVIDVSGKDKTRSVLITDSEHILCCAEDPSVLAERWNALSADK